MSLAMAGITEMLTPKGLSARDRPKNGASYTFNGPVNTTAQGNPVPLGYGRMIIGSASSRQGFTVPTGFEQFIPACRHRLQSHNIPGETRVFLRVKNDTIKNNTFIRKTGARGSAGFTVWPSPVPPKPSGPCA